MPGNRRFVLESLLGFVVIAVALCLVVYFIGEAEEGTGKGHDCYPINIVFNAIDGIEKGSLVKISGVPVGKVVAVKLGKDYQAQLVVCMQNELSIPSDSAASIVREGLLSSKHIKIDPGMSEENLKEGDYINHTQSSINLESLIGKLLFGKES